MRGQVLNQSLDGERDAILAAQFEEHRLSILKFLRGRVGNVEQAEDLLQQVFLRLLERANWDRVENRQAYIRTTARHVLSDFYRHQGARDKGIVIDYQDHQFQDETWTPGRALQSREHLGRLAAVLDLLSPNVRNAFVMSRIFGYTYAEIGRALSISPRTVEKHVAKGLAMCLEGLSEASTR